MAKRERQCTSSWLRARDTRQSVKNSSLVKATEKTQSSLKITNSLQKMRGKTQSFFNTSLCQKRVTRQSLYKNTSFIAKSRSCILLWFCCNRLSNIGGLCLLTVCKIWCSCFVVKIFFTPFFFFLLGLNKNNFIFFG